MNARHKARFGCVLDRSEQHRSAIAGEHQRRIETGDPFPILAINLFMSVFHLFVCSQ